MKLLKKTLIIISLFMVFMVSINAQTTYIYDNADTLSQAEENELQDKLAANTDIIKTIYLSNPSDNQITDPESTCQQLLTDDPSEEAVCLIVDYNSSSYYLQFVNGADDRYTDSDISPLYNLFDNDFASDDIYQAVADFADYFNTLDNYTGDYNKNAEVENLDKVAIMDLANLLTADEAAQLDSEITAFKANTNYDFAYLSVSENDSGKDISDYAYDYYHYNNFGSDSNETGIAIVIDMANREYAFKTFGNVIDRISDSQVSTIDSGLQNYLANGEYYNAISYVLSQVQHVESGDKVTNTTSGISIEQILIGLFGGLIAAGAVVFGLVRQLNNVSAKNEANQFIDNNSLKINRALDLYLYTSVTKTAKPKKSAGGGSSSSFGSGGSRSGGSSGHF